MGHGAYRAELKKHGASCASCNSTIGIEYESGTILVICTLAPHMQWANVGRVALQQALNCPGPKKPEDERIAFLKPPDS
jgi:hypothetical protein